MANFSEGASASSEVPSEGKCQSSSYKLDWYQTETQVVLNVLAKNVNPEKFSAKFSEAEIDMTIVFKDGTQSERTVHLLHEILPSECKYKVLSTKVEMRLPKKVGLHWSSLETEVKQQTKKAERNWDKYLSEIEDEKLEGEAVLNSLFQKIYNEGSDEVKKAMNKSFLESGGTELNTNWDAVSKAKVSVKPPEGMEWRNWEK